MPPSSESFPPTTDELTLWQVVGRIKRRLDDENRFCDDEILRGVLSAKVKIYFHFAATINFTILFLVFLCIIFLVTSIEISFVFLEDASFPLSLEVNFFLSLNCSI